MSFDRGQHVHVDRFGDVLVHDDFGRLAAVFGEGVRGRRDGGEVSFCRIV